ncbi:MAG: helix-turn-helix transcriptional regulator [Clostridia bacterium]|nr:helix-turn-helix transcriptional regulator [Clostridia bacterium]
MPFPLIDVRATGQNIDHLMKQRQISVRTLQTYYGFDTPRAIYKWLRGEHLPSVDHLFALGKLLRVPLQDILIEQTQDDQDVPPIMRKKLRDFLLVYLHNCHRDLLFYPALPAD